MVTFNPNTISKGNLMSACVTQFENVYELVITNTNGPIRFMYFDTDNDLFEILSQLPIDPQNITYE